MVSGFSGGGFGDCGAEGGDAAGLDGSVAAGEALAGVAEELLCAGESGGLVPGAEVGQGEEPGGKATHGQVAFADECVASVEGAVALVEEGDVAGEVTGSIDDAERADEFAVGDEFRRAGLDAGDAPFDFDLGFVGLEGHVGWLLEEGKTARVGDELDVGRAEFFEEGVDGAEVVHVGVSEKEAANGRGEGAGGGEDIALRAWEAGVDEGEAVGFADEVAVDEAETGELGGVGGDLGGFHLGIGCVLMVFVSLTQAHSFV